VAVTFGVLKLPMLRFTVHLARDGVEIDIVSGIATSRRRSP
jgi:hypothetical protein